MKRGSGAERQTTGVLQEHAGHINETVKTTRMTNGGFAGGKRTKKTGGGSLGKKSPTRVVVEKQKREDEAASVPKRAKEQGAAK